MSAKDQKYRSLWAACLGSRHQIDEWLEQAHVAINRNQDLNTFVAHAHPANRRKAKAAYELAQMERGLLCD